MQMLLNIWRFPLSCGLLIFCIMVHIAAHTSFGGEINRFVNEYIRAGYYYSNMTGEVNVIQYIQDNALIFAERPWMIYTSSFLHGFIVHILFNCMALVFLGPLIEKRYGILVWLQLFILGSIFTPAAQVFVTGVIPIGISGMLLTMYGFLISMRRFDPVIAEAIPWQNVRTNLIILVIVFPIAGLISSSMGFFSIANTAHLSGLALGWLLGYAYGKRKPGLSIIFILLFSLMGIAAGKYSPKNMFWNNAKYQEFRDKFQESPTEENYDQAKYYIKRMMETADHSGFKPEAIRRIVDRYYNDELFNIAVQSRRKFKIDSKDKDPN